MEMHEVFAAAREEGRLDERGRIVEWVRVHVVSAWEDRPEGKLFRDLATDIENGEHITSNESEG